jgi:hypothetical protein
VSCQRSWKDTLAVRQYADLARTVKSYPTREHALEFVAGKNPPVAKDGSKDDRFYAVASGREPGIYTSWDQAALAIKGWKGPKFKKFGTRAEAVEFIREHGGEAAQKSVEGEPDMPLAKKVKKSSAMEVTSGAGEEAGIVHIYTDGSSLGNGKSGAAAGLGVFFGASDPRYVSYNVPSLCSVEANIARWQKHFRTSARRAADESTRGTNSNPARFGNRRCQ